MNHSPFKFAKFALCVIATSALAACGGGGGSTPPTTAPTGVAPGVANAPAANLVGTVSASTYSPATQAEEISAFNTLNAERLRCGFGLLAQSTALDNAAKGHADWQLINNFRGHFQTVGTAGFTGASAGDRASAAGYSWTGLADENTSVIGSNVKAGYGASSVLTLLQAPYHAAGLLNGWRDVGFSVRNDVEVSSTFGPRVLAQVNLGHTSVGPQIIGTGDVATYPCAGATNVKRQLTNESPNPVPGRDLAVLPLGSTVYMSVRKGQTISISSASMTALATGLPVTLRTPVTSLNDVHGLYGSHEAYVSADAPLQANSAYDVIVTGTNNGVAFSRSFQFTTGL